MNIKINLETPQNPIPQTIPGEWKPLIKVGNYGNHPAYGEIEFTPQTLESFYKNFKNNIVGRELSFNLNHNSKSLAVLWIKDLRTVTNETGQIIALEYLPEYTQEGFKLISGGEYKYLSLEFSDNFQNSGPTLLGGAATNDPFVVGEGLIRLSNPAEEKQEEKKHRTLEDIVNQLQTIHSELKTHPDLYRKSGSPQIRSLFSMALKNISSALPNDVNLESGSEEATNLIKEAEIMPDTTEVKTLEAENEVKKLQAELESIKLQRETERKELHRTRVEKWQLEALQAGLAGGGIEIIVNKALELGSNIVKLDNSQSFDILSFGTEILKACPKVQLSQIGDGKKVELENAEIDAAIKLLENSAKEMNQKRGIK